MVDSGSATEPGQYKGPRSLRSAQSLLVRCLGDLIRYAYSRGYDLTLGEAFIQTPRKARDGRFVEDGVHMPGSLHYSRLAIDLNLFVRGAYITNTDDLCWHDLGNFWEALDPSCAWGGRFHDGNHFSIKWQGRK